MRSKPKSNSVITHTVEGQVITFTVAGAGAVTLNLARVDADLIQRAAIHGFIQRVSDGAAISRDPATGQPASPADKLAAMQAIVEHYESGTTEWSRKREGGGNLSGGLLLKCLTVLYPVKPVEALREFLKGKSPVEKTALLNSPKVKKIADDLRAASVKGVEVDLSELER